MAKNLIFTLQGACYEAAPVKIERKKLYGWSEVKTLDDGGDECDAVQTDETGSFIIPKGGLGMGILSQKGEWVDRSDLKALTIDGKDAPLVPSSYDAPIVLDRPVSVETLLDCTVTAFYQLSGAPEDFVKAVGDGIYAFVYNLRTDYEGADAFLLTQDNVLYMLTGFTSNFEMLGMDESAVLEDESEDAVEDEAGEIDFSMF
jgi:hypothetical protein